VLLKGDLFKGWGNYVYPVIQLGANRF